MRMEELTFVLTEMQSFEGVSSPLRSTNRIKYSCFAASDSYVVFGATSGGIYVFRKNDCAFMHLLPNKEGAVTHVAISPDEKWFGFATVKGVSCAIEHSIGSVSRRIVSSEHEGFRVTALHWNPLSSQLYVGDESGRISVISTCSFLVPTVTLMQLDSQIVQLDCYSHLLLVSTFTRCYLCDTYREQYRQIGSRARDGMFGGCFYSLSVIENKSCTVFESDHEVAGVRGPYSTFLDGQLPIDDENLKSVKIFCTRPGLRLWEVHVDGTVISTHQFKRLLDTPPSGVIRPPPSDIPALPVPNGQYSLSQAFNFTTLHRLCSKFLFTFHPNGIYILDPLSGDVVLWTDEFVGIKDVCVVGCTMFVWMGDFQLHSVNVSQLDHFLIQMYLQKQYGFCANMCASYVDVLSRMTSSCYKLHVVCDLLEKLKENNFQVDETVYSKVSQLLFEVSQRSQRQQCSQILNSGIFVVGNAHFLSQGEGVKLADIAYRDSIPKLIQYEAENVPVPNCKEEVYSLDFIPAKNCSLSVRNSDPFKEPNNYSEEIPVDDYDPFADLPFSALTSPETVAALKQISSTVSETISNGTKSLKEKWHFIEEKIKASEAYQSSVLARGMGKNVEKFTGVTLIDENKHATVPKSESSSMNSFYIDISVFENLCEQLSTDTACEDQRTDFLKTLLILFETYRKFVCNIETEISFDNKLFHNTEDHLKDMVGNLLDSSNNLSFPFFDYFSKDMILDLVRHFHLCLRCGIIVHWLQKILPRKIIDETFHPPFYKSMYSVDDIVLDLALGKFLQFSKCLLDPHIILDCLEDSQAPCQYWSWNIIVDCFNKGPLSVADTCDYGNWPLPCLLNAMLVVLQLGQTESCRNLGLNVPIKYVLRLILKQDQPTYKAYSIFLSYLDKLPMKRLKKELQNAEVFNFTKLCFEDHKQEDTGKQCKCGFPLQTTKSPSTFTHVGSAFLLHLWETHEKPTVFKLCHTHSLWPVLLSKRRCEALERVLPLLLQAGCFDELRVRCEEISLSLWEQIFELQENLQAGICLNCRQEFHSTDSAYSKHWSLLATLLLQETDPVHALKLITKFSHSIPPGSISYRFYQSCLVATVAEKHSKGSGKPLLNTLVYSSELPCMSSELAKKMEICVKGKPEDWQHHHWGLHLKPHDSNCMCCLLPLNCPRLMQGWGLTGFKCGHAFHSICLVQSRINTCLVCAVK